MIGDGTIVTVAAVLAAVVGLAVGSFLNVVTHRVPAGESVVRPPSRCPSCDHLIEPRDNIPVLSWLLLRGRCRWCSAPIAVRYPIVEATTSVLWALLTWWGLATPGAAPLLPLVLTLASAGVALTVIDVDHHRLPNVIVLPLYPVTALGLVAAGLLSGAWNGLPIVIGALLWLIVVGLPWLLSGGRGMGMGDVKLAPVLGATLGWWAVSSAVVGLLAAFGLGAVVGIALMATGRAGRKSALPFGPFLLVGALIGLLLGPTLGAWYAELALG